MVVDMDSNARIGQDTTPPAFVLPQEYPEDIQVLLRSALKDALMIPAETVQAVLRTIHMETGQFMIQMLPIAASRARVPISRYHVGAVALGGSTGSLYFGANMEFPGQPLSCSVHAEQSAINHAWLNGESTVEAIAINAAPCGYCRQFMNEITKTPDELSILLKSSTEPGDCSYISQPLSSLLPNAFGPEDLGVSGGLMEKANHGLSISATDPLVTSAAAAANASYAPFTHNYCGVALQLENGNIYSGRYAENAAHNPSLSPLHSALALMNMSEPLHSPVGITAAVMVEAPAKISQRVASAVMLSSLAPKVVLQYFKAH